MRRYDWASQMFSVIDAYADVPFQWGENDCCLFVARVVDAMCDTKHEAELATHYSDEQTALEYIEASGGIAKAVSTYIGEPQVSGRPKRGDVVLIHFNDRDALGVCVGDSIAVQTSDGIGYVERGSVLKFWSI
jgi:hypothetical protein